MKCTILATVLGLASLAVSAPAALVSRQASLEQVTDSYMFDISIDEFITNRNTKNPPELDWSSNGCTASPDNPFGFDCMFSYLLPLSSSLFHPLFSVFHLMNALSLLLILIHMLTVINSCYRHDFGYRNFKAQNRFEANKARIDDNFKTDMFNQCANESAKGPCEATATLYYEAVKAFGRRDLETAEAE